MKGIVTHSFRRIRRHSRQRGDHRIFLWCSFKIEILGNSFVNSYYWQGSSLIFRHDTAPHEKWKFIKTLILDRFITVVKRMLWRII